MRNEGFEVNIGNSSYLLVERKRKVYVRTDMGDRRLCRAVTAVAQARHPESKDVYFKLIFRLENSSKFGAWMKAGAIKNPAALAKALADKGFSITTIARSADIFAAYLDHQFKHCDSTIEITPQTGWHNSHFVMPGRTYGPAASGVEFFGQSTTEELTLIADAPSTAGNLQKWQTDIGIACKHSRLILVSVGVALAGPCLKKIGAEPFIFHTASKSSEGKSVTLQIAQSVWRPAAREQLGTWDQTATGADDEAARYRHQPVILDELARAGSGLAAITKIKDLCFRLVGATTRRRADDWGPQRSNSAVYLSNGEDTISDLYRAAGARRLPGEAVRCFDVPIEVGAAGGVFDTLPTEFTSSHEFLAHLTDACGATYGAPAEHFLAQLASDLEASTEKLKRWRDKFVTEFAPRSSGTGTRLTKHFALIYATLRLAENFGTIQIDKGRIWEAVQSMWMKAFVALNAAEKNEEILLESFAKAVLIRKSEFLQEVKATKAVLAEGKSRRGIKMTTRKYGRVYYLFREEFQRISVEIGAPAAFEKVLARHDALCAQKSRDTSFYQKHFPTSGERVSCLAVKKSWLKHRIKAIRSASEASA